MKGLGKADLPAGLTEQPVSPAATNVKSKKGRDALEGASKAAGKRKHGGAAAAAAEPEPEAAQARGPEEGQAAPKAGSKTAGKRKHRRVAAAAAEPEAAQALGPALATRSWPYGAPEAGSTEQPVSLAATKIKPKKGRAALEGGSKAAGKRKHGRAAAAAAEPEPEAAQAWVPEEGQAAPKAGSKAAAKYKRRKVAAAAADPEPEAAQALVPALAVLKAASKSTGGPSSQAEQLQRVKDRLLRLEESLESLQKLEQKELSKDKPYYTKLDRMERAIMRLAATEQKLLDERKMLETQHQGRRHREAGSEGDDEAGPSTKKRAAVVWEHGKIPGDQAFETGKVQELPKTLRALFTAPAKWLEQLTPVKLTCMAGGYQKLWPNNKEGEEVLVQMMEAAIQERLGQLPAAWQQAALPNDAEELPRLGGDLYVVHRGVVVEAFLRKWHESWVAGNRRGCLNACCHESGMGKTRLADVLTDPPEHMIDSFVASVSDRASLRSLFSILCSRLVKLSMLNLEVGSLSLAEAFNHYMRQAAQPYDRPLTDLGSAANVMQELTTKFMGCPALVLCDEYQALENHLLHWLPQDRRQRDSSPKLQALRVTYMLWICLAPLIKDVPHVYVYACGRSLSLALIGKDSSSPTQCNVAVLPSLTAADIGEVIRNTLLVESTETVMARLRLTEGPRFIDFCSAIHYLSGGIPLFVLKALQGAVAADLDWKAMHNDTFQALTHSKISMERGGLQRRNSPSGLEALRRLQAHASSNSSPGADQIAALTDYKGLLAACIMADPAARLRWRPDDVEHATLMMHALLEMPLPAAEAATDMGSTLRLQLSTSTMQWEEDAHGNLRVLLPAALLANCHQPVAHDLLPVIASQLQQVLQQPDWNRSSWPVMEWLFQDVYLAKLAKCFREASTATLKDLLPVTLPNDIAGISFMPAQETVRHVPAFKVKSKEVTGMNLEDYDKPIKRLQNRPWASSLNITDAWLLRDAKLLDPFSLALPAPGSAGPDSFLYTYDNRQQNPSSNVLVYHSGKLRASSPLTEEDIATDINYAKQLKSGMEKGQMRFSAVIVIVFTHGRKSGRVSAWAAADSPIPRDAQLSDQCIPEYMSVYITGEGQLKRWLTAGIYQSLQQVCDKSAEKSLSCTPVGTLMQKLQLMKAHVNV